MSRSLWSLVVVAGAMASMFSIAGCARTVSRDELERLPMEGIVETVNAWWYMGSANGFHWFHNTRTLSTRNVRIKADQLGIRRTFPLTLDSEKWVKLPWGVWFVNDPKVEKDFIIDADRGRATAARTGGEPGGKKTQTSAPSERQ